MYCMKHEVLIWWRLHAVQSQSRVYTICGAYARLSLHTGSGTHLDQAHSRATQARSSMQSWFGTATALSVHPKPAPYAEPGWS